MIESCCCGPEAAQLTSTQYRCHGASTDRSPITRSVGTKWEVTFVYLSVSLESNDSSSEQTDVITAMSPRLCGHSGWCRPCAMSTPPWYLLWSSRITLENILILLLSVSRTHTLACIAWSDATESAHWFGCGWTNNMAVQINAKSRCKPCDGRFHFEWQHFKINRSQTPMIEAVFIHKIDSVLRHGLSSVRSNRCQGHTSHANSQFKIQPDWLIASIVVYSPIAWIQCEPQKRQAAVIYSTSYWFTYVCSAARTLSINPHFVVIASTRIIRIPTEHTAVACKFCYSECFVRSEQPMFSLDWLRVERSQTVRTDGFLALTSCSNRPDHVRLAAHEMPTISTALRHYAICHNIEFIAQTLFWQFPVSLELYVRVMPSKCTVHC